MPQLACIDALRHRRHLMRLDLLFTFLVKRGVVLPPRRHTLSELECYAAAAGYYEE